MEDELYLEGTTEYLQLSLKVREQCCNWVTYVPDTGKPAEKKEIYQCDVSTEDRRSLIVQLFKEQVRRAVSFQECQVNDRLGTQDRKMGA